MGNATRLGVDPLSVLRPALNKLHPQIDLVQVKDSFPAPGGRPRNKCKASLRHNCSGPLFIVALLKRKSLLLPFLRQFLSTIVCLLLFLWRQTENGSFSSHNIENNQRQQREEKQIDISSSHDAAAFTR